MRARTAYLAVAATIVVAGLVWRLAPLGLPMPLVRHGGAALWGATVFTLVAAARPVRWGRVACTVAAGLVAVSAELFRLYHAPALDAFRGALAGALQLGRVFAPINILVYASGILVAAAVDRMFGRRVGDAPSGRTAALPTPWPSERQ